MCLKHLPTFSYSSFILPLPEGGFRAKPIPSAISFDDGLGPERRAGQAFNSFPPHYGHTTRAAQGMEGQQSKGSVANKAGPVGQDNQDTKTFRD